MATPNKSTPDKSTPDKSIAGIHHVTAITADAQKNIDFYTGVLGLRLVKLTVNFDDPGSYHLYYGDELGRPGTILTFFAWAARIAGRIGPPQVTHTALGRSGDGNGISGQGACEEHKVELRPRSIDSASESLALPIPTACGSEIVGAANPKACRGLPGPSPASTPSAGFMAVTIAEEGYEKPPTYSASVMGYQAGWE